MSEKIYTQEDGQRREATGKELEQIKQDIAEMEAVSESIKAKAAARESALAKLAALGLTEEEIGAL
jgi:hypothetical protein